MRHPTSDKLLKNRFIADEPLAKASCGGDLHGQVRERGWPSSQLDPTVVSE
jgi:hypothetical protein